MGVYITATALCVLFAYVSVNLKNTKQLDVTTSKLLKCLFGFLSFLPLTLIMAVRYDVGTDFEGYRNVFLSSGKSNLEFGFITLNRVLKSITNDPQSIFIVCAIVICGCNIYMAYKESISPAASILFFVLCKDYFISMNGMRQYMATAIMLLAVPYMKKLPHLKKSEWLKLILLFLISFSFHKSAVVFVLLCILFIINIPPLAASVLIAGTYMAATLVRSIIFPLLVKWNFYADYFTSASYGNQEKNFNFYYLLIFLCFFIMLSYEYHAVKQLKELQLMYTAVVLCLLFISLSTVMPINIHRLTWHMNCILSLYIPLAIHSFQHRNLGKAINCAIVVAYTSVTVWTILKGEQGVLPYQTFWQM